MTCPTCRPLCSLTKGGIELRRAHMAAHPDIKINPCHVCGGIDWATSNEMVLPELVPSMWRHFVGRIWR